MGSLKYEIACMTVSGKKIHKHGEASGQSMRAYRNQAIKFGEWCKAAYGCRHPEDCLPHIQNYADYLVASGKTASTVHTYLAGICRWFDIPLHEIQKPRRVVSANTRSRGRHAVDLRSDAQRDAAPRLYDFAERVGIRRQEYIRLRGGDLVQDESGYTCVRVMRGKGGKYQEQRILPDDIAFVSSYFDNSNQRVFAKDDLNNKLDLHHLRALQAQRAYKYYLDRLDTEPDYRDQLVREVRNRQRRFDKRPSADRDLRGYYHLRGSNRQFALAHGLPVRYDRLAVMAVSVFHLSHWRYDVTVDNYLLAI